MAAASHPVRSPRAQCGRQAELDVPTQTPAARAVLEGGKQKKDVRNANRNEHSRGRSLLPGHGTFSTWRLVAVGSGWWLVVGGGQLVALGSWRQLAVVVPGGCP